MLPFKAKYLVVKVKEKLSPVFVKIIRQDHSDNLDLECYWSMEEKYPAFGKNDGSAYTK